MEVETAAGTGTDGEVPVVRDNPVVVVVVTAVVMVVTIGTGIIMATATAMVLAEDGVGMVLTVHATKPCSTTLTSCGSATLTNVCWTRTHSFIPCLTKMKRFMRSSTAIQTNVAG